MSVLEVLAANAVEVMVDVHDDVTPTPVISRAIVASLARHRRRHEHGRGDQHEQRSRELDER